MLRLVAQRHCRHGRLLIAAAAPVADPAGANLATPSGARLKSVPGMVDSVAVAVECNGISAAISYHGAGRGMLVRGVGRTGRCQIVGRGWRWVVRRTTFIDSPSSKSLLLDLHMTVCARDGGASQHPMSEEMLGLHGPAPVASDQVRALAAACHCG